MRLAVASRAKISRPRPRGAWTARACAVASSLSRNSVRPVEPDLVEGNVALVEGKIVMGYPLRWFSGGKIKPLIFHTKTFVFS
jgi:hypothetical protein